MGADLSILSSTKPGIGTQSLWLSVSALRIQAHPGGARWLPNPSLGRGAPFGETGQALLGPAPLRETWDGSETSRDGGDAPAAVNYQEGNQTVSSLEAFLKETC